MITVELILDPTNWLEVNWLDVDVTPATYDEDGKEITQEVVSNKPVRSVSYHPTQLAMLQADAAEMGTDLASHQELLDTWVASYIPPDPAPTAVSVYTCSPWKIRKALNALGLRQAVEDAVAASTDQDLKDGWEFATEFRSDDPFVISMGAALGKSEEETAQLIQYASTL